MIRRSRHIGSEDDAPGGLASFASISDLMTALLTVFLLATAVLLAKSSAMSAELADLKRLLAAREAQLTEARQQAAAASRRPEPAIPGSLQLAWGLTLAEFERRQLAARVRVVFDKAFSKLRSASPAGNTISVRLPLSEGNRSGDLPSAAAMASGREAITRAFGTNWNTFDFGAGCGLGIAPDVKLFVTGPAQTDWTSYTKVHQAFTNIVGRTFPGRTIGYLTELSPQNTMRLLVSFALLPQSRERLRARFQRGPGNEPTEKLWCD